MAITFPAVFQSAIATDPAATTAGYLTPARHNSGVAPAGLATNGALLYSTGATTLAQAGPTWNTTGVAGEGLAAAAGTATTNVNAISASQTWNNAGVNFLGYKYVITSTALGSGSLHSQWLGGAAGSTSLMKLDQFGSCILNGYVAVGSGNGDAPVMGIVNASSRMAFYVGSGSEAFVAAPGVIINSDNGFIWAAATDPATVDTGISRISAGLVAIGTSAQGSFAGSLKFTNFIHVGTEIDLSYVKVIATAGGTVTMNANQRRLLLVPAGALATLTITLPPSPADGQIVGVSTTQQIVALTVNAASGSCVGLPSALAGYPNDFFSAIWVAADTTWYPSP